MSMPEGGTNRSVPASLGTPSLGARIPSAALGFPGDDGGNSLAEMAQRDLDAALQLLTDRAQYITGANGAAIALRREGKSDMLCRASSGSNVPELGTLLSTEFGLSGESVRTRRALRCDDAERDARVNRDVCREMGIASVVVMPVVNDDEVLGVFELFSGKVNAFGDRDLSALQRLSEMVETAVRLAHASVSVSEKFSEEFSEKLRAGESFAAAAIEPTEPGVMEPEVMDQEVEVLPPFVAETAVVDAPVAEAAVVEPRQGPSQASVQVSPDLSYLDLRAMVPLVEARVAAAAAQARTAMMHSIAVPVPSIPAAPSVPDLPAAASAAPGSAAPAPAASKKALFWSAAASADVDAGNPAEADRSHVPPVLRQLRTCEACGFPVSAERSLCVECEEKKWRGQLRRAMNSIPASGGRLATPALGRSAGAGTASAAAVAMARTTEVSAAAKHVSAGTTQAAVLELAEAAGEEKPQVGLPQPVVALPDAHGILATAAGADEGASSFVLSPGLESSQSWLSSNKYILGALLVVAGIVAAAFILR